MLFLVKRLVRIFLATVTVLSGCSKTEFDGKKVTLIVPENVSSTETPAPKIQVQVSSESKEATNSPTEQITNPSVIVATESQTPATESLPLPVTSPTVAITSPTVTITSAPPNSPAPNTTESPIPTPTQNSEVLNPSDGQPTPQWHCNSHSDSLPHSITLKNFHPAYSKGYRLYIRPSQGHCTGIALSISITGDTSRREASLLCEEGSCYGAGHFHVPIQSKNTWDLKPEDLNSLLVNEPNYKETYTLRYLWKFNTVGACAAGAKVSYGVAFALSLGTDAPPPASKAVGDCSNFNLSP